MFPENTTLQSLTDQEHSEGSPPRTPVREHAKMRSIRSRKNEEKEDEEEETRPAFPHQLDQSPSGCNSSHSNQGSTHREGPEEVPPLPSRGGR